MEYGKERGKREKRAEGVKRRKRKETVVGENPGGE